MQIPHSSEYPSGFAPYIGLATKSGLDFPTLLLQNTDAVSAVFGSLPGSMHDYRYAAGKWSLKELLLHLTDSDRVFAYRALLCIRGADTPMYPIDENLFAANAIVDHRSMESLLDEFNAIRRSTLLLFNGITEEQSAFRGNFVPGVITARALGYAIVGHAMHHLQVIAERYLIR
jgi:hypothetical protein